MPFPPENALPPALTQPQLVLAATALPPWVFLETTCPCPPAGGPALSSFLRAWVCTSDAVAIGQAGVTLHGVRLETGELESDHGCHRASGKMPLQVLKRMMNREGASCVSQP